jgi:hypothetical protein
MQEYLNDDYEKQQDINEINNDLDSYKARLNALKELLQTLEIPQSNNQSILETIE